MSEMTIDEVIRALHTQGITKITFDYSGGGDEGSFETPEFYEGDKKVYPDWTKVMADEETDYDEDSFLGQVYEDYGRLNRWYSFAGDYSCNGTVTINTETGDFDDSGEQSTMEHQTHTGNVFKDQRESF